MNIWRHPDRGDRVVDLVIFLGLGSAAVSRLPWSALGTVTARDILDVVGLGATSYLGYRYAANHLALRLGGILAFAFGWFAWPLVGLAGLWVAGWLSSTSSKPSGPQRSTPAVRARTRLTGEETAKNAMPPEDPRMARDVALVHVAATYGDRVRGLRVEFDSPYGEGVIPVLVQADTGVEAVYVEPGPWDNQTRQACLHWLALVRTSERDEIPVAIRPASAAPPDVLYYAQRTPRALFELAGLVHVQTFSTDGWAPHNAGVLRRLTAEFLARELETGFEGLEALDRLVLDELRVEGLPPPLPSTLVLLGSFFGEALINLYGGRWLIHGPRAGDVQIEVERPKPVVANVFGKIAKLLERGAEDSTSAMARAIAELS